MPTLNLSEATKLYYGNTEAQKLYRGSQLLYPVEVVDPYLANVVLHLKGDGENNSTNILDSSPTPKTITRFGDTKISTAQSKYGGSSLYFDGTGDYLTFPNNNIIDNPEDFTVEFWLFDTVSSYAQSAGLFGNQIQESSTTWSIRRLSTLLNIGTWYSIFISVSYSSYINAWTHIAVSQQGTTLRLFINGILANSSTVNFSSYISNEWNVGLIPTFLSINGYIDSLRITKGVARYTANFNPETDTYLAY